MSNQGCQFLEDSHQVLITCPLRSEMNRSRCVGLLHAAVMVCPGSATPDSGRIVNHGCQFLEDSHQVLDTSPLLLVMNRSRCWELLQRAVTDWPGIALPDSGWISNQGCHPLADSHHVLTTRPLLSVMKRSRC